MPCAVASHPARGRDHPGHLGGFESHSGTLQGSGDGTGVPRPELPKHDYQKPNGPLDARTPRPPKRYHLPRSFRHTREQRFGYLANMGNNLPMDLPPPKPHDIILQGHIMPTLAEFRIMQLRQQKQTAGVHWVSWIPLKHFRRSAWLPWLGRGENWLAQGGGGGGLAMGLL